MKNRRTLVILLTFAVAVAVLAGCNKTKQTVASAVPASGQSSSQREESSQVPQSENPSSGEVASANPNEPTESQPGQVLKIETDDKEFNAKFVENPIDKAYIKESNSAISNIDMVNVSNKYSEVWQKEITYAYSELTKYMGTDSSQKPKTLKKEQEDWVSGKAAALKKISDKEQALGGSMVQVNIASETMDFYRSRAAQLYKELYGYHKDYSYAFKQ